MQGEAVDNSAFPGLSSESGIMSSDGTITGSYQSSSEKPPSTRIIEAIAEREGVDQTELPPLFDTVDPEALDTLAADGVGISFDYAGYRIEVIDGKMIIQ